MDMNPLTQMQNTLSQSNETRAPQQDEILGMRAHLQVRFTEAAIPQGTHIVTADDNLKNNVGMEHSKIQLGTKFTGPHIIGALMHQRKYNMTTYVTNCVLQNATK